jgi:anti-sigma-K factor RskA
MWKTVLVTLSVAGTALASTSSAANRGAPDLSALQAKEPTASVQALYEDCIAADSRRQMLCAGYVSAMSDHMWLLGGDNTTRTFGTCVNTPVSYGAAVQTFKNWAQKHPEKWSLDRMYGVIWALQETWPCK